MDQSNQAAIVETGGKQYLVHPGDIITVERLAVEAGSAVTLPDRLSNRSVTATILEHAHTATVRVVKFHNKTRSYRRHGHRQPVSRLRVDTVK